MPKYGFGTQPNGSTGGGIGTPLGLPLSGAGYERIFDVVDVREIDPVARDYVVDDTTDGAPHYTMGAMSQRVLLTLSTPLGQMPCAQDFGDDTLNKTKIPTADEATRSTERALASLVEDGEISVESIVVEPGPRGVLARAVTFTDLATGEQDETSI